MDSSYEVRLVNVLEKFGIYWHKNREKFPYNFKGQYRNYIPDFYLDEIDVWVETKGMIKEEDPMKWTYFPNLLRIILKKDLGVLEKMTEKEEILNYLKNDLVLKLADKQD